MLKVVETFSGIGAQAKALKNIGCDFEIIGTADWDIKAMIAYDLIHYGPQDLSKYVDATRDGMLEKVKKYTLSTDGKSATEWKNIKRLSAEVLRRVCAAIDRTHNYVSVTDIDGALLPAEMNTLTYSFPCQDLSVAHQWHGATEGIDRTAANRSSQLWEIERILNERKASSRSMPKFLLMENVPNIISRNHNKNFEEWKLSLENLGYHNHFYVLNSNNFGTPQIRKRAYLISIFVGTNSEARTRLSNYFRDNDLAKMVKKQRDLSSYLRLDYADPSLRREADDSQPNDSPSRDSIFANNTKLFDGSKYANVLNTITTKQDRHPNAGVIVYNSGRPNKAKFRYLSGRECLLLMGFEDQDYEAIMAGNFKKDSTFDLFTNRQIEKLAGNSIVVSVLEEVFKQIVFIDEHILSEPVPVIVHINSQKVGELSFAT